MIMLVFFVLFAIASIGQKKKMNNVLDRVFPWLGLSLFAICMFLMWVYDDVPVLPEENIIDKVPIMGYFFTELTIWLISWPVFRHIRKKRKAKELEKVEKNKKNLSVYDTMLTELPDKEEGRRKLVERFNEKYGLNLKDNQIKSIVDGSFLSTDWALEVLAMDKRYASVSEWYAGNTDWLRAYLMAFSVTNISADFELQQQYCLQNFEEALTTIDVSHYGNIMDYIQAINNTYMTNFDETSFMVAYRFLKKHGIEAKLPQAGLIRATSEIDALAEKYDNSENKEKLRG